MELEKTPTLVHAHQQVRLGDGQVTLHRWLAAIENYARAIDYFKIVQDKLVDTSLISIIQVQIIQCDKAIHLCRLKDRSEQVTKAQQAAERLSKMARVRSSTDLKSSSSSSIKTNRPMTRHNTVRLENRGMDSFAFFLFPNNNNTSSSSENLANVPPPPPPPIKARKKTKHDSHKIEELQMSNEALRSHLKALLEDNERLKLEKSELLRERKPTKLSSKPANTSLLMNSHNDDDSDEDEDEEEEEQQDTELGSTL